jgi:hypothetical protein
MLNITKPIEIEFFLKIRFKRGRSFVSYWIAHSMSILNIMPW